MDKVKAEKVVTKVFALTDELMRVISPLEDSTSEAEYHQLKTGVGRSLVSIMENILQPIFTKYPDLAPEYLRNKNHFSSPS